MSYDNRELVNTGFQQRVDEPIDRIPPYDSRSGNHLWTVLLMHRVDPSKWVDEEHTPTFDLETLLSMVGPGCYYCEEEYSTRLAKRRCLGEPK